MVVAAYRIEVNGKDLTETWRKERRLLSIEVMDKLGASADSCSLELDDQRPHVAWPPAGAQLRLWLGPSPDELRDLGTYTLDMPEASGPPHRLRVTGHAASFVAGGVAAHADRALPQVGGHDLVRPRRDHRHRARHQRESRSQVEGVNVGTLEQTDETDLSFLPRVTLRHGARVRVRAGQIEIIPSGALITKATPLGPRDLERWDRGRDGP